MKAEVIVRSERLLLRQLTLADAPWIVPVLNNPEFLRFVGDRRVSTPGDAERYLHEGPFASYLEHGFGLGAVVVRCTNVPVGIAGVLRRPELSDPDIGYAIDPEFRGRGYAGEAAALALEQGHGSLGFSRLLAIVDPDNKASCSVLARLGFRLEGLHQPAGSERPLELHAHP